MIRLAINGYGRIGRCVLRALYESAHREYMQIVAINEPADLATVAHLTRYDSTHGRFPGKVSSREGFLEVDGDAIAVSHVESLTALDWSVPGVDVVLECSGSFATLDALRLHLHRGARRVLLSQPGNSDIPALVYGVNHREQLSPALQVVSNASCTTNAIAPVIAVLQRHFGIEAGTITTIHSAMNDQPVLDAYHHTDLRKTRSAGQSVIPVDTELAGGIARILPEMHGRLAARALRVPVHNVSAMEFTALLRKPTEAAGINAVLREAAENELDGVLGYTEEPLASCDFNHDPRSAVVDAGQTRVSGPLVNVLVWFDNEWAYANRMLDVVAAWLE